ncbi:hypothetical protein NPIL_604091, partial [Nephila pilipes]
HYPTICKWLSFLADNEALLFFKKEAIKIIQKRMNDGS